MLDVDLSSIQRMLKGISSFSRARCYEPSPADEWVDASGTIILIGHAAHPMLVRALDRCASRAALTRVGPPTARCAAPELQLPRVRRRPRHAALAPPRARPVGVPPVCIPRPARAPRCVAARAGAQAPARQEPRGRPADGARRGPARRVRKGAPFTNPRRSAGGPQQP